MERSKNAAMLCLPARLQITTPPGSPQNTDTSILWTHSGDPNGFHFRSNSTWYVLNSLDNPAAHLPLSNNCASHLVDSKAGHYISVVVHCAKVCPQCNTLVHVKRSVSMWTVTPMKGPKMEPCCDHQPNYNIPPHQEPPEIQIPPYYGHTVVIPTVSVLEGLLSYTYKSAKIRRMCPL